jgi:hypothetical protein
LSVEQITDLAQEVTNYLVEQGYSTSRAEIPQQNLATQILNIDIIAGYLEDIIFNENDFLDRLQRFSVFGFFGFLDSEDTRARNKYRGGRRVRGCQFSSPACARRDRQKQSGCRGLSWLARLVHRNDDAAYRRSF